MPIPAKTPLIALMRLEAKHVAALNKILAVAIADLDKQIKKMGSDNPITIMQAKAQREAMNDFMNRTFDSMEDVARAGMSEAALAASRVVSQYEDELLKLVLDKSTMANLAKSEANRAAAGLNAALKRMQGTSYVPLSQTVYKTKQLASGWVDETINKALASGWSRQRLAQELRKSIDPKVPGGVSYAANRTARTEINNAFHAASADRYMNSVIVEGVDWHLSSSHPEGDICDQLEADSPYPKKEVPKKPHPNCYCYITPHLPTEDEFLDNLFAGKYDDGAPWAEEAKSGANSDLRKILDMEDEIEMVAALNSVLKGKKFNGFDVQADSVEFVEGVGVRMTIMKDGEHAGFATREFFDDYVYHDTLELVEKFRGQGFSSSFSEFMETAYRNAGYTEIRLHAALDNGGYVWAKAGYQLDIDSYRDNSMLFERDLGDLDRRIGQIAPQYYDDEEVVGVLSSWQNIIDEARDDIDALDQLDMSELANLQDANGNFIGRLILNGASWLGRKVL